MSPRDIWEVGKNIIDGEVQWNLKNSKAKFIKAYSDSLLIFLGFL